MVVVVVDLHWSIRASNTKALKNNKVFIVNVAMRKEQRSVPIRLVQMLSRMAVLCSDPVFPRVFPRLVLRISPTLIKQRNSKYYIRHIEEIGNSTRIFQLGFPLVFFCFFLTAR